MVTATSAFDFSHDEEVGIENVPAGWHKLVKDMEEDLRKDGFDVQLVEVGGSNGTLTYNAVISNDDEGQASNRILQARILSQRTCEKDGKPGERLNTAEGIHTYCQFHHSRVGKGVHEA